MAKRGNFTEQFKATVALETICERPRTSQRHPHHQVYPYSLQGMLFDRPNQIWCADNTFAPFKYGFLYLVGIMDRATRKVLSWRLGNTMHADRGAEALKEATASSPDRLELPR